MSLVKTSVLNGLAVAVKLGTTLALNKVLAVHIGPTGYAVIGQFQNLVSMILALASGSLNTGVTKYTAEFHESPARQHEVWRAAAMISLIGGGACAGLLLLFRKPLAAWALADESLSSVMVWLAGSLLLLLLNTLLLAILSGRKAVKSYVLANIAGSLVTAITAAVLVVKFGLYGALVALAISQGVALIATIVLFSRSVPTSWRTFIGRIDPSTARRLASFALMGITSALLAPLTQVLIRDGLASRIGWHDTGLWQALWRISETHLMLMTTTLSLYFLPRFSEIRDGGELLREVVKGYRFVVPVVLLSASALYLLRGWLVPLLLSHEFLPLVDVLGWQLVGDVLKICSWVVAYTLISHAQTRIFVTTEIVFSGVLVLLSVGGAQLDGLRGAAIGYTATYLLYGAAVPYYFVRLIRSDLGAVATTPA